MVHRSFGWALTLLVGIAIGGLGVYYAPSLGALLSENWWQTPLLSLLAVVVLGVLIWSIAKPTPYGTVIAIVLTVFATLFASWVLGSINWWLLGIFVLGIGLLVVLFTVTVLDRLPGWVPFFGGSSSAASATTP